MSDTAAVRSPEYEREWLLALGRELARNVGDADGDFVQLVEARLAVGPVVTADGTFEARLAAADVVVRALVATQRRLVAEKGGQDHLQQAALYAALADWHLRQAARAG